MKAKNQNIDKQISAKTICDGLMETPSCVFVALFRHNKRVIGYQAKDQLFSRAPAGTQLERIQKELENPNTPPNIYEIRYTSSLNNSDGYQSVMFNKTIGRIYSLNDNIDKVELPKSKDYIDKTANDVLIEIAELRIANQYLLRDNEKLIEENTFLENELSILKATLESLEQQINDSENAVTESKSFLTKVLEDPEMLNPIMEKAGPVIGFLLNRFFPEKKPDPVATPTNGQDKKYPPGFQPLEFNHESNQ